MHQKDLLKSDPLSELVLLGSAGAYSFHCC
jgi:hypothetical protein